jgi:glutaredoxin
VAAAVGCDEQGSSGGDGQGSSAATGEVDTRGKPADPPFEVEDNCEGLLLAWFDEEGVHTAQSREEIPKSHRAQVRVTSLQLPPEKRLDPGWVYVADLREAGEDGNYPVRKMRRAAFDAIVDAASSKSAGSGKAAGAATGADSDVNVVIYGASWCEACDKVASFLERRGVPYVEKDIEKNQQALSEMQQKAKGAGIQPTGIPIIDYRGTLVQGFNRKRLERLIDQGAQPI